MRCGAVIFIPWSAVNLADYFLVRRGNYDVASFFAADGAYSRFAWRGLLAYAIGLAAEWPFVSQPDYTGPLVKPLRELAGAASGHDQQDIGDADHQALILTLDGPRAARAIPPEPRQ